MGLDGFYLIWESQQLLQGNVEPWIISPLSLLGLLPFSGYPVGSVISFSICSVLSAHNIALAILYFDLFFIVLMQYCCFKFSIKIFNNWKHAAIFTIFYMNNPIMLQFSYFTSSPRLPAMAILPILLLYIVKYLENEKLKNLLLGSLIFLLMNFFHRMASAFLIPLILIFLYVFFKQKLKASNRIFFSEKKILGIIFVLSLFIYTISIIFAEILPGSPKNPLIITTQSTFFNVIIHQIIDYFFAWGLVFFLLPFGVLFFSKEKIDLSEKQILILSASFIPFILFSNYVAYFRFIFLPIISIFGTVGTRFLIYHAKWEAFFSFSLGLYHLTFFPLYNTFWRNIQIYLSISVLLGIFFIIRSLIIIFRLFKPNYILLNRRKNSLFLGTILVIGLIFTSQFIVDSKTALTEDLIPTPYISEEELLIADFLISNGMGLFTAYESTIEARIAAYSKWYQLNDLHGITLLLIKNVTTSQISRNIVIKPIWDWYDVHIYDYNGISGKNLWIELMQSSVNSTFSRNLISTLNLRYFISEKNQSDVNIYGNIIESSFIKTLENSMVFQTKSFKVWCLNNV